MKQQSFAAIILTAAFGIGASLPAQAASFATRVPTVSVNVAAVESQAQLAQTLAAQGYSHITLSSARPSLENPHPELSPSNTQHCALTPVHNGWNGVAQKSGETVQVYVTGL